MAETLPSRQRSSVRIPGSADFQKCRLSTLQHGRVAETIPPKPRSSVRIPGSADFPKMTTLPSAAWKSGRNHSTQAEVLSSDPRKCRFSKKKNFFKPKPAEPIPGHRISKSEGAQQIQPEIQAEENPTGKNCPFGRKQARGVVSAINHTYRVRVRLGLGLG